MAQRSNVDVQSVVASMTEEQLARVMRYAHVEPSEFLAVKDRLGLSSKECAAAIERTPSRVSELTHSKGASRAIYNAWVERLEAFAAQKAQSQPAAE